MTPPVFAKLVVARPDLPADPVRHVVVADALPVRAAPAATAALDTEALRGETVDIYETVADSTGALWGWGQLTGDSYVGWLPMQGLALPGPEPTHRVVAPRTFIFPGPSIKLPPAAAPPLGASLTVVGTTDTFCVLADGGHVPAGHLVPLDMPAAADPVAVARSFLGVPYLWGGKTMLGLDCSGLTQIAYGAAGHAMLRDSHMQEQTFGEAVAFADPAAAARRGDLVFWKGHVGLMATDTTLIHANAHFMMVVEEDFAGAVARIASRGDMVMSIRRFPSVGVAPAVAG
jgi:cell wall-associated NlpC family hydrolase